MTTNVLKRMLANFEQDIQPQMFLSSFFKTRPDSYYEGDELEVDIERYDEGMAAPVPGRQSGYREIDATNYTNKNYVAPIYKEAFSLSAEDMLRRQPGQVTFSDPTVRANFMKQAFKMYRKLLERVEIAVEDQAAQVLTTGEVSLTDADSKVIYTIDYFPKSTHFTTAAVPWSTTATSDPIADLEPLCLKIRDDGKTSNLTSLWDVDSFEFAMKSVGFKDRLSSERRINLGAIVPLRQGPQGEQYRGSINLGNFELDIWTYNGRRESVTGTQGPYIPRKKVIILDPDARLQATYGSGDIRIVDMDPRLRGLVPNMLQSSKSGVRMSTNAWADKTGTAFWGGASVRPLLIPVAIDTFGCLDTDLA